MVIKILFDLLEYDITLICIFDRIHDGNITMSQVGISVVNFHRCIKK